jgi:hypothetical protein
MLLNAMATPMEHMSKQLSTAFRDLKLTTRNVDEIDLLYRVALSADTDFSVNNDDPFNPQYVVPAVSGYADGEWYEVDITDSNTIREFWYEAVPNRISLEDTVSGMEYELISDQASNFPVSGEFSHHLGGGRIFVETTGGIQYLTMSRQELYRGQIIITGKTRKGTEETETLIFPWDMKQPTTKEWKEIYQVDVHNIEDDVQIDITSADFIKPPYLSHYNLAYSDGRAKIDEFWDINQYDNISALDRVGYVTDDWRQMVLGFSNKETKESWELLDENYVNISGVDLAIQPFTDRAWVVTAENYLYCYDTNEDMVSGVDLLKGRTPGADVQVEAETSYVVLGEDIRITPWHARPIKEIRKYRVWYQTPSGTKYGLLNGSPVSYSSDFWVTEVTTLKRTVETTIALTSTERGEYLFVVEVEFIDGETQTDKRIIPVNYKQPLVQFNLNSIILDTVRGIDFDSDQQLWISTDNDCYQINLHTDNMLIDYTNKLLFFRENYSSVVIDTDG